jgi:hypothetical protein
LLIAERDTFDDPPEEGLIDPFCLVIHLFFKLINLNSGSIKKVF